MKRVKILRAVQRWLKAPGQQQRLMKGKHHRRILLHRFNPRNPFLYCMDKLLQSFLISITIAVPAIIGLCRFRLADKHFEAVAAEFDEMLKLPPK